MNFPTITLLKGKEKSILRHHPWIFSGAIKSTSANLNDGEIVAVSSFDGKVLGYGNISLSSQIRVRMISFNEKTLPTKEFVKTLVKSAVKERAQTIESENTATRLINAENDALPGFVADWYNGFIVCQITSALANFWKDSIFEALNECTNAKGIALRNDLNVRARENLPISKELEIISGLEPPKLIEINENGVKYFVDVRLGHKTGFYLDQKDARLAISNLSKDKTVLNCFCYTGGFGHAAVYGGAKHVTQVDMSSEALNLAREIAKANDTTNMDFIEDDVFNFLRKCRDARKQFDLIILDPPKFAENKSQLMKAARGYKDINLLAMKLLSENGILATFSCSGAMTRELFDKVVADAALDSKRDFQIISRTRQATDHPVALSFPEGLYLKGLILRAMN